MGETNSRKSAMKKETTTAAESPYGSILKGVVAHVDLRTDFNDDASEAFEKILISMGAKCHKTVSAKVTHLIFKAGNTAALKKALDTNKIIVNAKWVTECRAQGVRVPEDAFIIQNARQLSWKKERKPKSMAPTTVMLYGEEKPKPMPFDDLSSLSDQSDDQRHVPAWVEKAEEARLQRKRKFDEEKLQREKEIEEFEAQDTDVDEIKLPSPVQSVETSPSKIMPFHSPNAEIQKEIKARFSIGPVIEKPVPENTRPALLVKCKKRKLLSSKAVYVTNSNKSQETVLPIVSPPKSYKTIVLTSMSSTVRTECQEIISKLGNYHLSTVVDENTSHVIVGSHRRTKSVIQGISQGVWMLSPEWLIESGKHNRYVSEQKYELLSWYPNVEQAREGVKFIPPSIKISVHSSSVDIEFIKKLVQSTGATLVQKDAHIILCDANKVANIESDMVSENWLFESIENWCFVDIKKHTLNK